jgi:hypothetical protein
VWVARKDFISMISAGVEALMDPRFLAGVSAGFVVLGLGLVVVHLSGGKMPAPYGGLLLTGGSLVALAFTGTISPWLVAGISILGISGFLHTSFAFGFVAAAPGAVITVVAVASDVDSWIPWFAVIAIMTTAPLLASFDGRYGRTGLPLPLFAASALGVYLTVPDTEFAIVVLGTAAIAGFLGWPKPVMSFGASGAYASIGLYVAAASTGAIGRPAALIAAVSCLGLLVVAPVAHRIFHTERSCCFDGVAPAIVIGGQIVLVLLISRMAGRFSSPWLTALLCAAILTGVLVLLAFVRGGKTEHV